MSKKTTKKAAAPKKSAKKASSPSKPSVNVKTARELYNTDTSYCQYNVSTYKKAIEFYKEVLELNPSKFSETSPDPEIIGWFEFELPLKGSFLGLNKSQETPVKTSGSLVISVTNLEELKAIIESKKVKTSEITDVPNMISFLTVNDPDNNSVMFISNPRIKS